MAKKTDIRITTKGAYAAAPSPKAKKKSAVKSKKTPTPKTEMVRFDAFTTSYLDTAIWADRPEDCDLDEVFPDCIRKIWEDCQRFQLENEELLDAAYSLMRRDGGDRRLFDLTDAGHDFWLSRNGHGAGYWDRGLGEVGEKLHKAAAAYGQINVLPGDGKMKRWLFIE